MTNELITGDAARYEHMTKVVDLFVQGKSPTLIAKQLELKRVYVQELLEDWRNSSMGSQFLSDRMEELMISLDKQYDQLKRGAYEIIEEVDNLVSPSSQMLGQKANALKLVADFDRQRIEVMIKSGLIDSAAAGNQLAELEENVDQLMKILEKYLCDTCKTEVYGQLAKITGTVVSMDSV